MVALPDRDLSVVLRYHEETKHHAHRYARSPGYLDWATQPYPFRHYEGCRPITFPPVSLSPDAASPSYGALYGPPQVPPAPITLDTLGHLFRFALGLSAWKQAGPSRWALRVNPSSGNLHPTEGYLIAGPVDGLDVSAGVYHYDPESHALEQRCRFSADAWMESLRGAAATTVLVGLSSIAWREAWKYGERAFRYCQHDTGHAVAAIRFAAALLGWEAAVDRRWAGADMATAFGLDRASDFIPEEIEEAECVLVVGHPRAQTTGPDVGPASGARRNRAREARSPVVRGLVNGITEGAWTGSANRLSRAHAPWPVLDEVATASRVPAAGPDADTDHPEDRGTAAEAPEIVANPASPGRARAGWRGMPAERAPSDDPAAARPEPGEPDARRIILQRRSGVAFDPRATMPRHVFLSILARLLPGAGPPWDALWWPPAIDLALFVHRVDQLAPGIYLLARRRGTADELGARNEASTAAPESEAGRRDPVRAIGGAPGLFLLAEGDVRRLAAALSCGQDIAGESVFSLGMLADFGGPLVRYGASFYRNLFWEAGVIGQVLYLEAEAAGFRGTGIGCYFDDGVHEVLGLEGDAVQSLYHFTVGVAVEDRRLTTSPGYEWEPAVS